MELEKFQTCQLKRSEFVLQLIELSKLFHLAAVNCYFFIVMLDEISNMVKHENPEKQIKNNEYVLLSHNY